MISEREMIYFITGNDHKFHEINALFEKEQINFLLKQKNVSTIEIQAKTVKEVALFKLKSIKMHFTSSYFIEDAGFFVDEPLKGFPGVYSKYVLKTIGNEGILKLINDFSITKAHFETIIALYYKPADKIMLFDGKVEGMVSSSKRGKEGFGFDPIFIPNEIPNKTFAELTTNEKNNVSHRGKAFSKLIRYLKDN
jgi:XTP/dITP diphosphohydrolase